VVASFSPRIFTRVDVDATGPAANQAAYCVCALGGQDCVVSVWLTCKAKAACVVHGLFTEDVLDLSWASDGATLLACSMDGSVACVRLEPHEIGVPLPHEEQADRLASLYGHDHGAAANGGAACSSAPVPHSAQMLLLEGASPVRSLSRGLAAAAPAQPPAHRRVGLSCPVHAGHPPMPATPPADSANRRAGSVGGWAAPEFSPEQVIRLQRETKTKDGRRRITPVAVDLPVVDMPDALPPPAAQDAFLSAQVAAPGLAGAVPPLSHGGVGVAPSGPIAPSEHSRQH
jgi:protein HIRA/HIR1